MARAPIHVRAARQVHHAGAWGQFSEEAGVQQAARGGLDGQTKHGFGKLDRFQVYMIFVMRVVQDRIEMDFLDFCDGGNITGNREINLDMILAFEFEQMTDLEGFFAIVDE